jgi:hypothetical protein
LFKTFCTVVGTKGALSDLSSVRMQILNACTPNRFALFHMNTAFLEALNQDVWPEDVAKRVLENLVQTHTYPFFTDKYGFLLHALRSAGYRAMHDFLLREFRVFIPSPYTREEILLMLATKPPYDFAAFYYKNEFRILEGIDHKYSTNVRCVKSLCFRHLTLLQKIFSPIPILMP